MAADLIAGDGPGETCNPDIVPKCQYPSLWDALRKKRLQPEIVAPEISGPGFLGITPDVVDENNASGMLD